MILKRPALALALVAGVALASALFLSPASAAGLTKGSTVLSFQLAHGDADLATPEVFDPGYITAYDHTEWGGQIQLQHLLSENWALAVSAGIGTTKETDEPGTNALPGAQDFVYKQSSFNGRFGFDRFVHLSPEFHLFAGPGIQYWSGKGKFDDGTTEIESESTNRIALSGRIGANIALGESVSLVGHIGGYMGRASAEDAGAKATWQPSGNEGAIGVGFSF